MPSTPPPPPDEKKYHLALFPDAGEPEVRSFKSLQGMADCLRTLPLTTRGIPFHGDRIYVTRGPFRYLLFGEESIPLFDPPKIGKIDHGFGLGHGEDKTGVSEDPLYTNLVHELDLESTPVDESAEEEPPL